MRRLAALVAAVAAVLGLTVGLIVGAAGPAAAHAILESTTPEQGSQVATLPTQVSLHFSETVGVNARSIEVLDPAGHRVDLGDARHPKGSGSTVVATLKSGLPKASYAVVWHVVSADSHPVGGTFSFGYGVPAGGAPPAVAGDTLVGFLHGVSRSLAFAGVVLLVGGSFFLVVVWPAGAQRKRPRRLVAAGWVLVGVSSVLLFLLEGPYGAGVGLGDVFEGDLVSETLATRYGKLMAVRLLLLVLAIPVLRRLHERDKGQSFDLAGLGITMLLTFTLSEHAGQGIQVPLAATADALHIGAASVWIGGLAVLATALLWKRQPGELAEVLPRWSRTAMVCVAVLVLTGTYQTWREVGTLPALWDTHYGRLLLIKWGGFALLLALGNAGRLWIRRHVGPPALVAHAATSVDEVAVGGSGQRPAEPSAEEVRRLRRSVGLEVLIGAGVLVVTALLVNSVPGRTAYAPSYTAQVTAQDAGGKTIKVTLDVTRTKVGPTTLHAYVFDATGKVLPVSSISGDLEQTGGGLGPVRFSYSDTGFATDGHGTATGVVVPGRGRWTLTVQIVTLDGDDYAGETSYKVRA
ncbi:MAG TPA: copper resistance protein CopC [Mycobacteriales bacterium]|nr:copper resistance protein CopC [Mycobacteriales bacterium]